MLKPYFKNFIVSEEGRKLFNIIEFRPQLSLEPLTDRSRILKY